MATAIAQKSHTALTLSAFSLIVAINIHFSFTQFLKEIFLDVVLKANYVSSNLKVIGKFIPSTGPYIW